MSKIANFENVARELLKIKKDYKNDIELCNRIDNILKQFYINMTTVYDIVKNNIKQGEV